MKKVVLTILILLLMMKSMAQSASDFFGEWKVEKLSEKDQQWTLKKTKQEEALNFRHWGQFFQFNEDGTYSEYASAPCGMDDNRYRYSGKWIYHADQKIIELKEIKAESFRPEIYMNYKLLSSGSMEVISYKNGDCQINILKAWEKTSMKKQ
jgi:hypothetical protein